MPHVYIRACSHDCRGPGVDHVQGGFTLGPVERASQRLAVDGDDLVLGRLVQGLDPAEEAALKLGGVEPLEKASEGVVGGDAVGQVKERLEPVVLTLPKSSMSSQESAPATTAQIAMRSRSSWSRERSIRGSVNSAK